MVELLDARVLLSAVSGVTEVGQLQSDKQVAVPAKANAWKAYSPTGTTSPVTIFQGQMSAGQIVQVSATGSASHNYNPGTYGPDGWTDDLQTVLNNEWQTTTGIGNGRIPLSSLMGVFIAAQPQNASNLPAPLDFRTLGRNIRTLRPELNQPFFIGDGLTGDQIRQSFIVPAGSVALVLGNKDGSGWDNNYGGFVANVSLFKPKSSPPPSFTSPTTIGIAENTALSTNVTATVPGSPSAELVYALAGGADQSRFSISPTGILSMAAKDFESPSDADANNSYLVTVQVSDGINNVTQNVTINVSPVNDNNPVFTSSTTQSVAENSAFSMLVAAADQDLPGDILTYSIVGGADQARFSITTSGVLSMAAKDFEAPVDANRDGLYEVQVGVSDGINKSELPVRVRVTNINDSPVATDGTLTTDEDTTATGTLLATDADGNSLTFSLVDATAAHGTVTVMNAATGAYRYVPAKDFQGPASFTFRVSDGMSWSNMATIGVTVKGLDTLFVTVPIEDPENLLGAISESNLADWKSRTASGGEGFEHGYVSNGPESPTSSEGWGWSGVVSAAAEEIGRELLGAFFSSGGPSNPFANQTQNQTTTEDEQILYGDSRDNTLSLNHKQSVGLGGKGKDDFKQSANYTTAYGNEGADTFTTSAKNTTSVGGPGSDTYKAKSGTVNGKILDTSPSGTIDLSDVSWSNISMALHGSDLSVLTADGRSLKLVEFSAFQRDGWSVKTTNGVYSIENALNISKIDAARVALAAYDDHPDDLSQFGLQKRPQEINDGFTGLQATVYDRVAIPSTTGGLDSSGAKLPPGHVVVGIAGTNEFLLDAKSYLPLGSPQYQFLKYKLELLNSSTPITNLTLIGESLGGMDAVAGGMLFAADHSNVTVNIVAFNTLGIPDSLQKYASLPNIHITYINYEYDFLHTKNGIATSYPIGSQVIVIPGESGTHRTLKENHDTQRILDFLNHSQSYSGSAPKFRFAASAVPPSEASGVDSDELPVNLEEKLVAYLADFESQFEPPQIPQYLAQFDFGTAEFLKDGWQAISPSDSYTDQRGSGFKVGTNVVGKDLFANDDLRRDMVVGKTIAFQVQLEAGSYDLTLIAGDDSIRQNVVVRANGKELGEIGSLPKEIRETTFRVTHLGGILELELKDIGGATSNAVLNGLVINRVAPWAPVTPSTAPVNDPSLIVFTADAVQPPSWLEEARAIVKPVSDIIYTLGAIISAPVVGPALIIQSAISLVQSSRQLASTLKDKNESVAPWVFQAQAALNLQNARNGLPLFTPAKRAIPLTTVENSENSDFSRLFPSNVIIIDSERQLSFGAKPFGWFGDGVGDAGDHREGMNRVITQTDRVVRAKIRDIVNADPGAKVDIYFIGVGFGATANRETIDRLAESPIASSIDHVGLEMIAPIAAKEVSAYNIYHPEGRPFSLTVNHWFETISDVPSDFNKSTPLDGKAGGSRIGQLNDLVRVFGPESPDGQIFLRNLSNNGRYIDGTVSAAALSSDGRFSAQGTTTGFLSVFNLKTNERVFDGRLFKADGGSKVAILDFSDDGQRLVILREGGVIATMNLAQPGAFQRTNIKNAVDAEMSADGSGVLIARKNGEILFWPSMADGSYGVATVIGQTAGALAEFWTYPGGIASLHGANELRLSKVAPDGSIAYVNTIVLSGSVTGVAISADGSALTVANGSKVVVYRLSGGNATFAVEFHDNASDVQSITISGDGLKLITGGDDRIIRAYDLKAALNGRRAILDTYKSPMLSVRHLSTSSDGRVILASFKNADGGGVRDVEMNSAADDRVGFYSIDNQTFGVTVGYPTNLFGLGEEKFHQATPYAWLEEFLEFTHFFAEKDNPESATVFGATRGGWTLALTTDAVDRLPEDEAPVLDDLPKITPIQRLSTVVIFDATVLSFPVESFFEYEGSEALSFSIEEDSNLLTAELDEYGRILLKPSAEGIAIIRLRSSNGSATAYVDFAVIVEEVQVAPTIVSVTSTGPQSLTLSWDHYGVGVKEFTIRKQRTDGSWDVITAVGGDERFVTINADDTKLVPGATYSIIVRAKYGDANLDSSPTAVTLDTAAPPSNVRVTELSQRQATIRWDLPNPKWEVSGFKVELFRLGDSTPFREKWVSISEARIVEFSQLDAGASYKSIVWAKNADLGDTAVSAQVSFKTDEFVIPVVTAISSPDPQSVTITWAHSGEGIQNFVIRKQRADGTWDIAKSVNAKQRSVTITSQDTLIVPGRSYTFQVRATYLTDDADSNLVTITVKTAPPVPNPSVDQKDLTSVRANWNQLSEVGVTHYRIVVYRAGTTLIASEKTVDVGSGPRSTTMTGLTQSTNYEMHVEALRNGSVLSNSSRVAFSTLQPAAPVMTSVSQSGSTIRFNWTHFVATGTSGNVVYRIERRGADGLWKTVKGGISASEGSSSQTFQIGRTASANPLDQNKTYDFRIVAVYSSLEVISSNILSLRIS